MHIYSETAPVGIAEVLAARDARVQRQQSLLRGGGTPVYLTMNIPGPVKVSPLIGEAFSAGVAAIGEALHGRMRLLIANTGLEAWLVCAQDAEAVKRETVRIEDESGIGRLLDIDVIRANGKKMSREMLNLPPRRCMLCDKPAFVCARSRAHSVDELRREIDRRIVSWRSGAIPAFIGKAAAEALVREAKTTPKPGLVDERNNGSHPDMNLEMLLRSARALQPYFENCARIGYDSSDEDIFPGLRQAGLRAEADMMHVTGGVNAHRGAIFSLGLLCAAAACALRDFEPAPERICRLAGNIAAPHVEAVLRNLSAGTAQRFGEKLYLETGIRGVRGEAADGFPTLLNVGLPMLRRCGGARALICLLAATDDTTLIRRGGLKRASEIRAMAKKMIAEEISDDDLIRLDELFIRENLTCGGCADLLACAYFLEEVSGG